MIVYNYHPVPHYFIYIPAGKTRPEEIFTQQWQGIDMLTYPEAALALMTQNERYSK